VLQVVEERQWLRAGFQHQRDGDDCLVSGEVVPLKERAVLIRKLI
jgi:hypothetical protein